MAYIKDNNKKIFSLIILAFLSLSLSFLISPKSANAQLIGALVVTDPGLTGIQSAAFTFEKGFAAKTTGYQVSDTGEQIKKDIFEQILKPNLDALLTEVFQQTALQMIRNITEATVNWIKSGFNGNPAFISNLPNFLAKTEDQVVGDMIYNDPNWQFLCSPFRAQVRVALGLAFQGSAYYNKINCTASGIIDNLSSAGWAGQITLALYPQNTALGAYLIAEGELESRIASKQAGLVKQLDFGRGALTFQQCSKTFFDKDGHQTSHQSLPNVGSQFYVDGAKTTSKDGSYYEIVCNDKTPGAVITDTLGFTVTSDQRMNELRATLGNGINAVIGALLSQLEKSAFDLITNTLGDNSSNNTSINSGITSSYGAISSKYAAGVTAAKAATAGIRPDFSGTGNGGGPSSGGSGITTNNNIRTIDQLISQEQDFQNTLDQAIQIDTNARAAFDAVRVCNSRYTDATHQTRATLIYQNVIENIDGRADSARNLPNIIWNLIYLNSHLDVSNSNINLLNTAKDTINATTSAEAISSAMGTLSPNSKFDDPDKFNIAASVDGLRRYVGINGLKTFFTEAKGYYSTNDCKIDLSTVLSP